MGARRAGGSDLARATIADIARKAGLSTAAVDRALNGRAGITPANRYRVFRAAKELGYLPSEGTVILPSRPAHLEFLIPFGHNPFMREVGGRIADFAASLPLVAECRIRALEGLGPEPLGAALEGLSLKTDGVGVVSTDDPLSRKLLGDLCDAGVKLVTMASDVPGIARAAYVGVDNYRAGRTAAQLMAMLLGGRQGSIGLFVGTRSFHGHREREDGFRALMREGWPGLRLLPAVETGDDRHRARAAMMALLDTESDLAGVYCVGAGRRGIVEAIASAGRAPRPRLVMHDLTADSRQWLTDDRIDAVIDQHARLLAEQAVIRLLGAIAAGTPMLQTRDIEPRIILRENIPLQTDQP